MDTLLLDGPPKSQKEVFTLDYNTPVFQMQLEHNGRKTTAPAILDTGAQDIYVPRSVAERLGYDINRLSKGTKFYGVKGGKTTLPIKVDKMSIVGSPKCYASPTYARTAAFDPLDGHMLLGRPFIRAVGMRISFDKFKETYRVDCTKKGQVTKESTGRVSLTDPKTVFRPFVMTVGRKSLVGPCYIDTGATVTLLPVWLALELGMRITPMAGRAQGAAGSFTILSGYLDQLELDGTPCRMGPMRVIVTRHLQFPIVGVDFFKHTGLVLDFSKNLPKFHCGR